MGPHDVCTERPATNRKMRVTGAVVCMYGYLNGLLYFLSSKKLRRHEQSEAGGKSNVIFFRQKDDLRSRNS